MGADAEGQGGDQSNRRIHKSEAAFRTISEVAVLLDVPQHVLRFWETKFAAIQPLKRGGGRRYYRPEDVALLRAIRVRLYDHGFTIKGVQKLLADGGVSGLIAAADEGASGGAVVREPDLPFPMPGADGRETDRQQALRVALERLESLKSHLDQVLESNASGNPGSSAA